MLANIVEFGIAVGVGPEPSLGAVVARAIFVAAGQIPEGNGDVFAVDPLPVVSVLGIAHGAQPVLTICVAPVNKKFRCQNKIGKLVMIS